MKISCDAIPSVTGIYLIRNKINNKVYIGQSSNIKRRMSEHCRSAQPEKYSKKSERDSNTPIHRAMQKYGIDNFEVQILEQCKKKDLNEREIYWIQIFSAMNSDIGYNLTMGGQNNFALKGEQHSQAKLSQTDVNDIVKLLKTSNLSLNEIAQQFFVSNSTICMINSGKTWRNENLTYPLRTENNSSRGEKNPQSHFSEKEVMLIRELYSKGITYKDLPLELKQKASESAIRAIQYGKTYKHLPYYNKKSNKWIEPCIDYSPGH